MICKKDWFTTKEPKHYEIYILKRLNDGLNSFVSILLMLIDVDDRYDILIRISAVHRLVYNHHMLSHA